MKNKNRVIWFVLLATSAVCTLFSVSTNLENSILQGSNQDLENSKQLVVMLSGQLRGDQTFGAGIIFGSRGDRLYIVTANHVVRTGTQEVQDLRIKFRFFPGERLKAQLLHHTDERLDLAVLCVEDVRISEIPIDSLKFDQLGDVRSLKRGDEVYHVGCPNGIPWRANVNPDRISEKVGELIKFESNFIAKGHSGGGLFNNRWELVGMIRADQPPDGMAVSIESIQEKLKSWAYPINLKIRDTSSGAAKSPPDIAKERQNLIDHIAKISKWGEKDQTIGLISNWLDNAIKKDHDADFCFGWGLTVDGYAYHLRWRDLKFSFKKIGVEQARSAGLKRMGTNMESRRRGVTYYMNRIVIGDGSGALKEGVPIHVRLWIRRGSNFLNYWVREMGVPENPDPFYLALCLPVGTGRLQYIFAKVDGTIEDEDKLFTFDFTWPKELNGLSALPAKTYLVLVLSYGINESGKIDIKAGSDGYLINANILKSK